MRQLLLSLVLLPSFPLPTFGQSWVWDEADANRHPQTNAPRYLRHAFTLDGKVELATLHVTCDNHYVAHVNGHKVGSDGEWATIEKYDVARHLVAGKNVLALKATNMGGVAGVTAWLDIKTSDKKALLISLDDKTKITQSPGDDWQSVAATDGSWANAIVLGDLGIGPWNLTGGAVAKGKGKKTTGYDTNTVDAKIKTRLSAEEQRKHFIVPKDFEIELVVADPLVINPITMVMDEQGRIIVSESHTYRYGPPGSPIKPYANPVIRLDPDGKGGFTRTLIADGFADPVMGIAVKGEKLWLTANNYLYQYDLPSDAPKKTAFFPSPPVLGGRGAGGEGGEASWPLPLQQRLANAVVAGAAPSPPTPLPLSTGGEGGKTKPLATNKKTLVTDLNKAWNPFGMFVLEWGPDGKLYLSVGNHPINLVGPDKDQMSGRGSSGIIVRMNPDGSKMERLVHGLRVPYSFDYDPFGQLWLLSNGEGNPNRFVRVIEGVDYHCYSRPGVDNTWLAGNHPLAPPCEELHRGADTQLMRYYGAAYPAEYQGNLFLCNWGAHGFAGPNRGIFRFVPDERNNIVKREPLVHCSDPHFRPAHIMYDQDGSILIADWYGRDDESDMTGRIWRLKYVGKDAPVVKHKLDSAEWKSDDYAISALGSPSHLIRAKAMEQLINRVGDASEKLASHAAKGKEPLGAANALWVLSHVANSPNLIMNGLDHSDWRVRRLAISVLERNATTDFQKKVVSKICGPHLSEEKDQAVLVARAFRMFDGEKQHYLVKAIEKGAAADPHLRYEAAWHLAKHGEEKDIATLLNSDDANVRLAGLIAIDVACYENFPTKKAALAALAKALENPGKLDQQLLLEVARLDGDASIVPALAKLIEREDLPAATIARAVLVLKAKAGGLNNKLSAAAGKRLIAAVETGTLKIASPADQLVLFEFLDSQGPTPFALKQVAAQLQSNNKELRSAAHTLARRFGDKASSLAGPLWPGVLNPKTKFEDALEALSTIARVEAKSKPEQWGQLLQHPDPLLRTEAVRWWRRFEKDADFIKLLGDRSVDLSNVDLRIGEEIHNVSRQLTRKTITKGIGKDDLAKFAFEELAKMPTAERSKRAVMGQQVFERNACTKCHTTATATTPLAPSLKGIAGQKLDYLIESVLYPSKVIKTGWELEVLETKDGRILNGLVKDDGKALHLIQATDWEKGPLRIEKADVESRRTSKISLMPEGQEATLSRREFTDLIAYLATLK